MASNNSWISYKKQPIHLDFVLTHQVWFELYKKTKIIKFGSILKMEFEFSLVNTAYWVPKRIMSGIGEEESSR